MTKDEHADLTARLEVLMGEFAPASDRAAGVRKLRAILDRVAVDEASATDPLHATIADLTQQLDAAQAETAKLQADLEAATTPTK